jgi:outer membrane lipoprotein-sorting protein
VLPEKKRSEMVSPFGQVVQVYDGESGWVAMGERTQDQTPAMKEQSFYGLDLLRRAGEPGVTAKALGEEELQGKKLARIEVADAAGHATKFWLDPETALPAALEFSVQGQTNRVLMSDFRDVDGVKVPFKNDIVQNGQKVFEIQYTEVKVNSEIDEKLFAKPAGAAQPGGR